ncbi:hypothetical protein EVAR_67936_1 [Eumeta japonica]|uniref:Uncharacterized protein n=1 Tax=Eumeta variegata TaxID=151549 RepID=A0A4C2A699_EUMVA|nr:hypothetical protein EVAR_67936_1 [Eumeta japonica]
MDYDRAIVSQKRVSLFIEAAIGSRPPTAESRTSSGSVRGRKYLRYILQTVPGDISNERTCSEDLDTNTLNIADW